MFLGITSDTWQIIGAVVAVIVALAGIITFVVRSIFRLGGFSQRLKTVETSTKDIKKELQTTRKELTSRIDSLISISIQSKLSEANSPRQLTDEGKKVLFNSGIDAVVNDKFNLIVQRVSKRKPENAYQAEQAILDTVEELVKDATIKDAVENGAFQSGYPVAAVLYVGGLHIRDRVLKELGFSVHEIDEHKPS